MPWKMCGIAKPSQWTVILNDCLWTYSDTLQNKQKRERKVVREKNPGVKKKKKRKRKFRNKNRRIECEKRQIAPKPARWPTFLVPPSFHHATVLPHRPCVGGRGSKGIMGRYAWGPVRGLEQNTGSWNPNGGPFHFRTVQYLLKIAETCHFKSFLCFSCWIWR